MKRLTFLPALLLCALLVPATLAQPVKYGQAGMTFLKIDVGARMAAMGGAYSGVSGDVTDMFANPAGLALLEGFEASTTYTEWIADIQHYGMGAAYRAGNLGTFGISFVVMDYGDFTRTVPYEGSDPDLRNQGYVSAGTFTAQNYAAGISYGRRITNQFVVGGHLRYAYENLGTNVITDELRNEDVEIDNDLGSFVFDFGTMYYTGFKDLHFGMTVRNFANQTDYYLQRFELPLTFDFGVAMDLLQLAPNAGPAGSTLMMALDWQHPRDEEERLQLGMEYGFQDLFFLRGGYKFNYDSEGLTAGLGVKAAMSGIGIKADYAYVDSNEFFGQIHRVSLGFFFQ